jgi:hypothetical protein
MPFAILSGPTYKGKTDIKKLTAAIDANFAIVGDAEAFADAAEASALAAAASAESIDEVIAKNPGTVDITAVDGEDGTAEVTLQIKDANDDDLEERAVVRVWISSTSFGAPEDDAGQTDVSVDTGTELQEVIDLADYVLLTDADGKIVLTITGADDTYHVMATCNGLAYADSAVITGNE